MTVEQSKLEALAKFLEVSPDDVMLDGGNFTHGGGGYDVYTDNEADERARDYILDSLWAFNAKFIISHSQWKSLADSQFTALEDGIKSMREKLCEDANPLVLALIDNIDGFVDDAISTDGRGHFLSGYDGEENEQDGFYIYRTN